MPRLTRAHSTALRDPYTQALPQCSAYYSKSISPTPQVTKTAGVFNEPLSMRVCL